MFSENSVSEGLLQFSMRIEVLIFVDFCNSGRELGIVHARRCDARDDESAPCPAVLASIDYQMNKSATPKPSLTHTYRDQDQDLAQAEKIGKRSKQAYVQLLFKVGAYHYQLNN